MKTTTIIALILSGALSSPSFAQPIISTNEFYHIGDVIELVNCDAAAVNAGSSGASSTWDFSKVSTSGGLSTITVVHDTASAFLTSNLLITLPNGREEHVKENSTDSYVNGIEDTFSHITTNYFNYDQSKRPITYNTTYVDTYRVENSLTSTFGTGYLVQTCDAYGTLILPTGTFPNVLRIKEVQTETDSTGGSISVHFNEVSYLWFDSLHTAPLMRIDTLTNLSGPTYSAMYLAGPVSTRNIANVTRNYTGAFKDNTLLLFGDFKYGLKYDIAVYNIIGTKIYDEELTAFDNSQRCEIGKQVPPGIYIVSIAQNNDPGSQLVIKVAKQ